MKKLGRIICVAFVLASLGSLVACSGFNLPAHFIRSEEVTEYGWKHAFDYDEITNVTITYTYSESNEDDWEKYDVVYEFDGDKMHAVSESSYYDAPDDDDESVEPEHMKVEMYGFLGEDGKQHYFMYDEESGEWQEQQSNQSMGTVVKIVDSFISRYVNSYSSFKYSEYHKGYTKGYDPESDDSDIYNITIIKISDELVSVVQTATRDEDSKSSSYTWIHAIDSTTVNIPGDIPIKPAEKDPESEKPTDEDKKPANSLDGKYYFYSYGEKNDEIYIVMDNGKLTVTENSSVSTEGTYELHDNQVFLNFIFEGDKIYYKLDKVSDGVLKWDDNRYFCKDGKTPPEN